MNQPVIVENDALRLEVWPQYGGRVSSVVDKADGYELLFDYPRELPTEPHYDMPYAKGWYAGWDECFPAAGAGLYPRHPYNGILVPDHGELWGLPTTAVPTKDGITTVWHGLRFGYRLTRKLFIEGTSLTTAYTLINLAPFDFQFVWSQHALLAMPPDVELSFPPSAAFDREGERFSRPGSLPANRAWKRFAPAPIDGPVTVRYPKRPPGRSLTIDYTSETGLRAYWALWVNTGGWEHHRHFAVSPTTGRHDAIDRAILDGSAATVGPSGRADWTVRWTVG
jgi:hypothetical protein